MPIHPLGLPAHIALQAEAPLSGYGRREVLEQLRLSFSHMEEIAVFLFTRTPVSFFTFHDRLMDNLLQGEHAGQAAALLGDFLPRLSEIPVAEVAVRGNLEVLPSDLRRRCLSAPSSSAGKKRRLTWLVNYRGKWEIIEAAKKLASNRAEELSPRSIEKFLQTAGLPDPDLIILTGGRTVLPDFLTYQISYGEFFFSGHPWPQFTAENMKAALESYSRRERRYGRL